MLLEKLYRGEFCPTEDAVPESEEYKECGKRFSTAHDLLMEHLAKNDQMILKQLEQELTSLMSIEGEELFRYGFVSGIVLMQEVREYGIKKIK